MKKIKINGKIIRFHGNAKDIRINNSKALLEATTTEGIVLLRDYSVGRKHIKRYADAVILNPKKVRVS